MSSEEESGAAPIPAPRDGADGVGGAAPGPSCREAPACGRRSGALEAVSVGGGVRVVFVDFGKGKVYALSDDGNDVLTFKNFEEMVDRLGPRVIVVDSLPSNLQNTAAELARTGIVFLRLKDLKVLSDERESNGVGKTDENDVRLLKTLYHRHPDFFQPLFIAPEELKVRALTELWVEMAGQKKRAKQLRTMTADEDVREIHLVLQRAIDKLAKRIDEEALRVPMYRRAAEELQLKGPALAYIIAYDTAALTTLPRDKLAVRYGFIDRRWRGRPLRSRLLILLANATVHHKHPRYRQIYEYYRHKGLKHWPSVLRVAKRILRDLRKIARTQEAGPPA